MKFKNNYIAEFSEEDGAWYVSDTRGGLLYEADMSKTMADTLAALHNGTVDTFDEAILFLGDHHIDLLEL